MKFPKRRLMSVRKTVLRNGMFLCLLTFSTPYAQARSADQGCEVLRQVISDAENSFRNVRQEAQAHKMDTATTYPARVVFADSQWCSVVISTGFFNENYSCQLRNTSVESAASLVRQCLGDSVVPDPKYQSDHFKVFNSATKGGAIVKVGQGAFADLVDITVNAGEPE